MTEDKEFGYIFWLKRTATEKVFSICNWVYLTVLRSSLKWFLHVFTGKSEIERLLQYFPSGAKRTSAVEYSLLNSKRPDLRQLVSVPTEASQQAVSLVIKAKMISKKLISEIEPDLKLTLLQINGYNQLIREVEWSRSVKYDKENAEHEAILLQLWTLLEPSETLTSRITKQWTNIGFQGTDPATDFRGMGLLGLEQLVYLAEQEKLCSKIVSLSKHPQIGFPFAIAGITVTALCRELLLKGYLKSHFFNSIQDAATMDDFHDAYCIVFTKFCEFWVAAEPITIMEFNNVKDRFRFNLDTFLITDVNAVLENFPSKSY